MTLIDLTNMKLHNLIIGVAMTLGTFAINAATAVYQVIDVKGSIIVNDNASLLQKGHTVQDEDILFSDRESMLKIDRNSKALTLRLTGKKTVKELIDNVPNKYVNVISNIQKNLQKAKRSNRDIYGVVTMEVEYDSLALAENEGFVFCEEDSVGNLNVIFMRHGMEKPQMYLVDAPSYIYLLKMAIISAQGYNYAYEAKTSYIYAVLWKPLEKFFKPGDTILMSIPQCLSVFDMDEIPLNEDLKMADIFNIYDISDLE